MGFSADAWNVRLLLSSAICCAYKCELGKHSSCSGLQRAGSPCRCVAGEAAALVTTSNSCAWVLVGSVSCTLRELQRAGSPC
jgi:hypothetical protein